MSEKTVNTNKILIEFPKLCVRGHKLISLGNSFFKNAPLGLQSVSVQKKKQNAINLFPVIMHIPMITSY